MPDRLPAWAGAATARAMALTALVIAVVRERSGLKACPCTGVASRWALDLGIATREAWPCPLPQLMSTAATTYAWLVNRSAEGCSTGGGRCHHTRRGGELHRCPGCLAPLGRFSQGLTRVSLASLVMASGAHCLHVPQ